MVTVLCSLSSKLRLCCNRAVGRAFDSFTTMEPIRYLSAVFTALRLIPTVLLSIQDVYEPSVVFGGWRDSTRSNSVSPVERWICTLCALVSCCNNEYQSSWYSNTKFWSSANNVRLNQFTCPFVCACVCNMHPRVTLFQTEVWINCRYNRSAFDIDPNEHSTKPFHIDHVIWFNSDTWKFQVMCFYTWNNAKRK